MSWSSRYTGVFASSGPISLRPHDPDVAIHAGVVAPWGARAATFAASGAGLDAASAERACEGEAIERLACAPCARDGAIETSFERLDAAAVDPARWVLFHPEQYDAPGFPFRPFRSETVARWVAFRDLDGEPVLVPEDLAFLDVPSGHALAPGLSTGLACGRFGDPVLLRGLQEVIERDALVGAWWGRYALEQHARAPIDDELRARVARPNLAIRFLRIATPRAAHATIVVIDGEDREGRIVSVGSAVRETRAASFAKSLIEAVQGRHYVRWLLSRPHDRGPPRDFEAHALHYTLHPEKLASTPLARARVVERDDDEGELEGLAALVERSSERPLFRNLTPPEVASARDLFVLRVVVPGLQPLHGDHALPFLGGPLWGRPVAEWSKIPPHPFP